MLGAGSPPRCGARGPTSCPHTPPCRRCKEDLRRAGARAARGGRLRRSHREGAVLTRGPGRRRAARAAGAGHRPEGGRGRHAHALARPTAHPGAEPPGRVGRERHPGADRRRVPRRQGDRGTSERAGAGGARHRHEARRRPQGARAERGHARREHRPAAAPGTQRRQQGRGRRHGRARGEGLPRDGGAEVLDRIPLGQVISQDPGRERDEAVRHRRRRSPCRRGPRSFPVATYIGLTKDAAIAQIEAAGLVAKVSYVPGGVQGKVVGQTPDPGTVVRPGDTITIFVA